jgi:TRAP-type mannitol/chloroaromatic compound transport system permease small subunit
VDIIGILFFLMPMVGLVLWLSWAPFMLSFQSGEMSANAGGLIRWPVKLLLPAGMLLLFLQGISELIKRVAFLMDLIPNPLDKRRGPTPEEELAAAIKAQKQVGAK